MSEKQGSLIIGSAIRNSRRNRAPKMTVASLSAQSGIPAPTIYGYENGWRMVTVTNLLKLATILDLDLNGLARQCTTDLQPE